MKLLRNSFFLSLLLVFLSTAVHAQTVRNSSLDLQLSEIANPDLRFCMLSTFANDGNFDYTIDDEDNKVLLFSSNHWTDQQFQAYFDETKSGILAEFEAYLQADKETAGNLFSAWKEALPQDLYALLFKLMLMESPSFRDDDGNQSCATSDPFCTTDVVSFHVEANPGGYCEGGPYYGCLSSYTQRPPFWFHMKIGIGGSFTIRMTNSSNVDIDYCCWGPFTDPVTPCPSQLTQSKYIDCGSSADATENCHIPNSAQPGQYYILVITKYNQTTATNISFQKVAGSGPGETDCGILPPMINNDGPYCVGDAIHLSANGQEGASYHWTGPNGFSSNVQNPVINNCTLAMAGTYNCSITIGNQTSTPTGTQVDVYAKPTANFTSTTVCLGEATQFTSTSTTTPANQQITAYLWDFGDGQTSTLQNPSHQFTTGGNHSVSLTVGCGQGACSNTKTQNVMVNHTPVASAGRDQTIPYGTAAQLHGSGGPGNTTYNYHWEPASKVVNANAQDTQTITLTTEQTFTLTVTNPQGQCVDTDDITIHIQGSAMTASASASPSSICQGDGTQLMATVGGGTGNFTYSWTPTQGLGDPHIPNPMAYPTQTTTYTCHVSDGQTTEDVSVTVTVNLPEYTEETHYMCPNSTFEWNGEIYTEAGDYLYQTTNDLGCEKNITMHLLYYPTYDETTLDVNICHGETYYFYGTPYNYTCHVAYTDQTIHGCDSIVKLNLNVYPANDTVLVDPTICINQSYNFHGTEYTQNGAIAYWDTLDNHGCLKVEKLFLTVGEYQVPPIQNEYICYAAGESPSFYWDKTHQTYTEDTYDEIILPDPQGGCDIKHRLNLKFHQEFKQYETVTTCDSYLWPVNGERYTSTNHNIVAIYDSYIGNNPEFVCDSTFVLDLTINQSSQHDKHVNNQCDEYTWQYGWNGETYSYHDAGDYTQTIDTYQGCDSTVTLKLQLDYRPDFDRIQGNHLVVGGSEFQYSVEKYSINPNPKSTHNTTWELFTIDGQNFEQWEIVPFGPKNDSCLLYIYTFERDSVELRVHTYSTGNCDCGSDTESIWIRCGYYDVNENATKSMNANVYPNPNNGNMMLSFENMTGDVWIRVFDLTGTLVDQLHFNNTMDRQTHDYQAKLPKGVYFLKITSKEGSLTKRVIIMN